MKTIGPLAIFSLPAVVVSLLPQFHEILCLDRTSILRGQLWRLWSGHWVHFSNSHLWWNLAAVICAAAWLEGRRPGLLLRFTALAAPLLSLGLLALDSQLAIYGGLSGIGTGVVTLLGYVLVQSRRSDRWTGFVVLALIATKLGHDSLTGAALLSEFSNSAVQTTPIAHALGAALALLFGATVSRQRSASNGSMPALINSTSSGSIAR